MGESKYKALQFENVGIALDQSLFLGGDYCFWNQPRLRKAIENQLIDHLMRVEFYQRRGGVIGRAEDIKTIHERFKKVRSSIERAWVIGFMIDELTEHDDTNEAYFMVVASEIYKLTQEERKLLQNIIAEANLNLDIASLPWFDLSELLVQKESKRQICDILRDVTRSNT
jgi:hypothetical protein